MQIYIKWYIKEVQMILQLPVFKEFHMRQKI